MSFLGKLFGGKGEEKAPSTGEVIQNLRENEEMLIKKQDLLEEKIDAETALARKNAKTNKRAALEALKRKKRYEKQLQQIDGTLSTIQIQREALEEGNTNTAVLTTMKSAADALKTAHNNMDVDEVHDMMDDVAEQQVVAKETQDAISNPVAFGKEFDEEDLEAELDMLGEEWDMEEQEALEALEALFLDVGPTVGLPDIPTAEPARPQAAKSKKVEEDDDDLAQLAAWAN